MIDIQNFYQSINQVLKVHSFEVKTQQNKKGNSIINKILETTKKENNKMPLSQNENQCQKLFQHLNYCVSILKKSLDQQKLEILKRVQHDIQLLQKYIKSLLKYNDKRESQFQKVVKELKHKDHQILTQNNRILDLSFQISKNYEEISKKKEIIQHLKYSKKIDASYVSSILINQNSPPSFFYDKNKYDKNENNLFDGTNGDGLNLSHYSQNTGQQKSANQDTQSQIKGKTERNNDNIYGTISQQSQSVQQRGYNQLKESKQFHKASSLIFTNE